MLHLNPVYMTGVSVLCVISLATSFGDPGMTLTEVTEKTDISEENDSVIGSQIGEATDTETISQKLNEISKHEKEDNTQGTYLHLLFIHFFNTTCSSFYIDN